jgi:hypothetical protein
MKGACQRGSELGTLSVADAAGDCGNIEAPRAVPFRPMEECMFPHNVVWVNFHTRSDSRGKSILSWKQRVERKSRDFSRADRAAVEIIALPLRPALTDKD